MLIIFESGMALFVIQLVRVVLLSLNQYLVGPTPQSLQIAMNIVIYFHQVLNVIIKSVHFLLILFY